MSTNLLQGVLEATGYFPDGQPASGLQLGAAAQISRRGREFVPDALWRSQSALTVYFKSEGVSPDDGLVSTWRREIWNEGFAPLLWVVSPDRIDLYNGFGAPTAASDARQHLIQTFSHLESSLDELDRLAGRLSIETGQFWLQRSQVNRKTSVDQKLLSDLAHLEKDLVHADLELPVAQALIGQVIFTQYLIDRQIVNANQLKRLCGHSAFPSILRNRTATGKLFTWLSRTFNGDMFPTQSVTVAPETSHLSRVADFLEAVDPVSGQTTFFPYRFDVIPVELISSIYEQFAHATTPLPGSGSTEATRNGVHYTRLSVVALILDEVMTELKGTESVLDLTCGSGVFLVEALRRLVSLRATGHSPTRELIRSTLYEQIYGVDASDSAIRVAAFSLYLAALELDPDPQPPHALKFRPLIGTTLLVADARTVEESTKGRLALTTESGLKKFDVIVGNPPWTFKGQTGTAARRRRRASGVPAQPRGEGLDFLLRAADFSHERTRFGMALSAMPFFSRSRTGIEATLHILRRVAPVTLVNLANLRDWLFETATMPAVILFARHRAQRAGHIAVVQIPWSATGARSFTFEVARSDVLQLSLTDIEKRPTKLKSAAVGRRRDLLLLDSLASVHPTLKERLGALGTTFRDGLTYGAPVRWKRDARELQGLGVLGARDMQPFRVPVDLPRFRRDKVQWPRCRQNYKAPLLIVKEMLSGGPRALAAVSERDLVFTDAYFGVSLPEASSASASLLAAIIGSSFASWFFTMTASEFGIWKRHLLIQDVASLPMPDLDATSSKAGTRLLRIESELRRYGVSDSRLAALDMAVCDLYDLDMADRLVVQDGLARASWQWKDGRERSEAPADAGEVTHYADVFLTVISGWLSARQQRRMRAEVFDLPRHSPIRVVRFVLENEVGDSTIEVIQPEGELSDLLSRLGQRLNVRIASALSAERQLRIHGRSEVVIVKPAAHRYWMNISALEDADAVVAESVAGGTA